MIERIKAVPAVYLLLECGRKILLMRRFNTGYQDGSYSVPAGHIDGDELPTEALVRETSEEIGVHLRPSQLKLVHTSYRPKHDQTGSRVDLYFSAVGWSGIVVNVEPHKCDDVRWFDFGSLPENTIPQVRLAIECFRKGVSFSELGVDWLKANNLYKL